MLVTFKINIEPVDTSTMDGQILEVTGKIQKLAEHIYDYDRQKDTQ